MSLRTFTVFKDSPSTDISRPRTASITSITSPTLSSKSLNINHATTLTTAEKENVHPLTGERAGPSNNNAKKRKTAVLAIKTCTPLTTKKQKESNDVSDKLDAKKRKSSAASSAKGKAVKKDGKLTSSRKAAKKSSRKVSPLPRVDEEAESEKERTRLTQAAIDSRCYELTVKPLADLSQAYEQGPSLETPVIDENDEKFRSVKASSVEPEIRDYFSSLPQSSALPQVSDLTPTLSTPERKEVYAAFTFTSPSPTSERFSKASRTASVPHLELV